jgi:hypothetical protein
MQVGPLKEMVAGAFLASFRTLPTEANNKSNGSEAGRVRPTRSNSLVFTNATAQLQSLVRSEP